MSQYLPRFLFVTLANDESEMSNDEGNLNFVIRASSFRFAWASPEFVEHAKRIRREKLSSTRHHAKRSCRCRVFCYCRFASLHSTNRNRQLPASDLKEDLPAPLLPSALHRYDGCAVRNRTRPRSLASPARYLSGV